MVSIADSTGKVIRRMDAPAGRGLQRVTWDLRAQGTALAPAIAAAAPVAADAAVAAAAAPAGPAGGGAGGGGGDEEMMAMFGGRGGGAGALVVPGKYTVSLAKRVEGVVTPLPGTQTVEVVAEGPSTREDRAAMAEFQEKLGKLQKALTATTQTATEAGTRLSAIRRAIDATPSLPPKLREETLEAGKAARPDRHRAQRRPRLARHQRRRPRVHLRSRAGCRLSHPRDHRPADKDRDGAIPDRAAMSWPRRFPNCASFSRPISRRSKSNSTRQALHQPRDVSRIGRAANSPLPHPPARL